MSRFPSFREARRIVNRDADALRLAKRLRKHNNYLVTFPDKPEVPFENNFADRMIRPAVSLRTNSHPNRSK